MPAFFTRSISADDDSMPAFSASMSARIRSAPALPLSFLSPAVWHVAQTPWPDVLSISSDGLRIAHPLRAGAALVVLVAGCMARRADPVARRAQHLVRRFENRVVAVTLDATLVEELVVDALLELLRENPMAGAAEVREERPQRALRQGMR